MLPALIVETREYGDSDLPDRAVVPNGVGMVLAAQTCIRVCMCSQTFSYPRTWIAVFLRMSKKSFCTDAPVCRLSIIWGTSEPRDKEWLTFALARLRQCHYRSSARHNTLLLDQAMHSSPQKPVAGPNGVTGEKSLFKVITDHGPSATKRKRRANASEGTSLQHPGFWKDSQFRSSRAEHSSF